MHFYETLDSLTEVVSLKGLYPPRPFVLTIQTGLICHTALCVQQTYSSTKQTHTQSVLHVVQTLHKQQEPLFPKLI